ncbi:protein GVQW3-like [Macrobrachium rosenbergii]|uniref:protein GVQW3-like n=1 Tax=Macrobrachium rosenbergii TaxID=79674 RepID=UPI0034D6D5FF
MCVQYPPVRARVQDAQYKLAGLSPYTTCRSASSSRYCIKFCYKLGDTQSKLSRRFSKPGDNHGSNTNKEWYNRFPSRTKAVESKPRSGRPSTSRNEEIIENVRRIVEADRHITINEITEEVGISTGSVHTILTEDLAMRRSVCKFVSQVIVGTAKTTPPGNCTRPA